MPHLQDTERLPHIRQTFRTKQNTASCVMLLPSRQRQRNPVPRGQECTGIIVIRIRQISQAASNQGASFMNSPQTNSKQAALRSATSPHQFPRRILLMVTGRTPQVVTETLYALTVERTGVREPFLPTEVHLVTTAEGAQDARLALLDPKDGWFRRLCADYDLQGIQFTQEQIHIIHDEQGNAVDDIRNAAEHEACADLITDLVRRFTVADDAALHVSLAGGRKTMTYYLGNALTLFGRPWDRLSHVLVNQPYESNREFFYPTPRTQRIYVQSLNRYFDAREAEVTLADIPFVRLRDNLPSQLRSLEQGLAHFTDVVTAMQQALEPAAVRIDLDGGAIEIADGRRVPLSGADLAFYLWVAQRTRQGREPLRIPGKTPKRWPPQQRALYADYADEYFEAADHAGAREGTGIELRAERAMTNGFFHQRKHSIHDLLEQHLGPLADAYAIRAIKPGRPAGYGLKIAPERIEVVGAPTSTPVGAASGA
ncbi:MAG TPA: TIGR02584 family CRISPR-associated protein [Chromatiaceae bacterium]|jgi:CRISPR-associated protein (TIGR02584 family)|nr:MAG: hypothetical protein N838_19365 [Thiohalocapsa sp. PB-PSB1]HCS91954.1 TIGR02584 family CRISPR-associated protein [Chromatiaceae bacterium]